MIPADNYGAFDEESALLASPGSQLLDDDSIASRTSIRSGLPQSIPALPGMQIRCHVIDKNGVMSSCTTKEALAKQPKNSSKHYWIDVDADKQDEIELREWLSHVNLPSYVLNLLAEPPEEWASQVVPLKGAALSMIRILPEQNNSDDMAHLAALIMRNLLLTFTTCPKQETGGFYVIAKEKMKQRERLPAPTASGALVVWLRVHIERTSRSTRELRYYVLAMDEAMDRDITSVELEEIIDAKDQLLRLLSVAEEQTECLESLVAAELRELDDVRGAISILLATATATERMALRLEKHIADLRERDEGHEQLIMNRRLAVLTVLSAVFLPLTLFTGIWGMNFENMPELSHEDAYPIALLFMISVAALMLCYFQRTGWFS